MTAVRQSFFSLLYTCGGYYTEEAAGEIWELLGPKIKQINNPECFVSLGWLMTLLPTKVKILFLRSLFFSSLLIDRL